MKLFTRIYVPDPNGYYVEVDEEIYSKEKVCWYKNGKRLIVPLSFFHLSATAVIKNLYECGANPIRMKAVWKFKIFW